MRSTENPNRRGLDFWSAVALIIIGLLFLLGAAWEIAAPASFGRNVGTHFPQAALLAIGIIIGGCGVFFLSALTTSNFGFLVFRSMAPLAALSAAFVTVLDIKRYRATGQGPFSLMPSGHPMAQLVWDIVCNTALFLTGCTFTVKFFKKQNKASQNSEQ